MKIVNITNMNFLVGKRTSVYERERGDFGWILSLSKK
jgi:hypothetical protein